MVKDGLGPSSLVILFGGSGLIGIFCDLCVALDDFVVLFTDLEPDAVSRWGDTFVGDLDPDSS